MYQLTLSLLRYAASAKLFTERKLSELVGLVQQMQTLKDNPRPLTRRKREALRRVRYKIMSQKF